jgi:hypothetical protein
MTHAETSSPDMRLVELECRNGHVGTPILYRSSAGPIGAHCSACRIWIKWVPQTEVWKSLLAYQEAMRDKPRSANATLPELGDTTQIYFVQAVAAIAQFCNDQAVAMGFLDKERSLGDMLTLINTEMSELFEAHRNGTSHDPSDHIPDFTQQEEEWADIGVRWFCHAVEDGVSPPRLADAFVAKLLFNRTRGYRHGGKRV